MFFSNDKTADQSKREQRTSMGLVLLHAYGVTKVTNVSLKNNTHSNLNLLKVHMLINLILY